MKKKNEPRALFDKRVTLSTLLFFGSIFLLVYAYLYEGNRQENYAKRALEATFEKYERIQKTDLSEELYDQIIEIVKTRKNCFASQISYAERNNTCKRAYTNQIVQLARDSIQSAPLRGLFIRCIRESPITGSLCSGEEGRTEQECIDMEARGIEYCLDEYWRGGAFPNQNNYTYQKNMKD